MQSLDEGCLATRYTSRLTAHGRRRLKRRLVNIPLYTCLCYAVAHNRDTVPPCSGHLQALSQQMRLHLSPRRVEPVCRYNTSSE